MEKRKILLASVVIIGIMLLLNSCTNYCDLELINVKTTSSCSFLDTLIKVGIPINEEETGPIDTLCSPQKGSVSYYRVNSSGEPKDHAGWFDIDFDNRTISRNSTHYVEIGERLLTLQIDCPGYYYYIIYMDCGDDSLALYKDAVFGPGTVEFLLKQSNDDNFYPHMKIEFVTPKMYHNTETYCNMR